MTPQQLYNREPESINNDISVLWGCYYCHVPELENPMIGHNSINSDRVQIKYYKNHCFDGRRVWILASVWFDQLPVMIIQNAGREGDDWAERYITEVERYCLMIEHIQSILPITIQTNPDDTVDQHNDIQSLSSFYNYDLDGYFDYW